MSGAADRDWMNGYEAARAFCLAKGVDAARVHAPAPSSPAYESGWDWGLWDYEDANGLPHARAGRGA